MSKKQINRIVQVLGIITFLILPVFFAPGPEVSWQNIFNSFAIGKWFSRALMVVIFYLHYYYIIPKFFFPKKYFSYILIVFVGFGLVFYLPKLIFNNEMPPRPFSEKNSSFEDKKGDFPPPNFGEKPPPPPPLNQNSNNPIFGQIGHDIYLYLIAVFGALLLCTRKQWELTKEEKLNAEISYLRAQINPHFIFNSLNNIYSLAIEKSDQTPDAVVKLSSIMRYVMSEANKDEVLLVREIDYIRNYIELQQLRFGDSIQVETTIEGNFQNKKIAPLLLISFIENAFKHGVNAEEDSEIKIEISMIENDFSMKIFNKKVKNNVSEDQKSGIGIENTVNRLKLLYPENHYLRIENNENFYLVTLKIIFKT